MRSFAKAQIEEYLDWIYQYAMDHCTIRKPENIIYIFAEKDSELIGTIGQCAMLIALDEAEFVCANEPESFDRENIDKVFELYHAETVYDKYVAMGDYVWSEISNEVNKLKIVVQSDTTHEKVPLHMQRSGFIVYLVYALDRDLLVQFIPSIEKIAKLFPEIGEELWNYHKLYQDSRSIKIDEFGKFQNADAPYQIHSDLYEGSDITRLMQLLQQIGEFRPEGDYDDSMKLEIHHDILKLLDKINPDQIQIPNE